MKNIFLRRILIISFLIFILFWILATFRHSLLQSNAYDLGLFDQWIWLVSNGLKPVSSMEKVHLLADHAAWTLYLGAIFYRFHPSLQWLFASQSFALAFTALPLALVGMQAGLSKRLCWLICGLWWLQPVVFNVNLFDFHPEVLGMPLLAATYFFQRSNRPLIWFFSLFIFLGFRDGLVLVVLGIGLENLFRKKWYWSFAAIGLACGWLAILNKLLYPSFSGVSTGPKAVSSLFSYLGSSFDEVTYNLFTKPQLLIFNVDWIGGLIYIVLISIALLPFFRSSSLPVLLGALPLVFVNFISEQAPQRTLIHHYSLPIAVIGIVAVIDGLVEYPKQKTPWRSFIWSVICWTCLAKPWFFTGPYLSRISDIPSVYEAIRSVPKSSKILTTSYIVPHLTHRQYIDFPRTNFEDNMLDDVNLILLNPNDPGWGSNSNIQLQILKAADRNKWICKKWSNGLEICKN